MHAIILSGGRGSRLGQYTKEKPKPMVTIGDIPLLSHQIKQLASIGISDFIIMEAYKANVIQEYYGDGSHMNIHIHHCELPQDSGSTAAIKTGLLMASELDPNEHMSIIQYGDILHDADIKALLQHHRDSNALLTVTSYPYRLPVGIIEETPNGVLFTEKPVLQQNVPLFVVEHSLGSILPDSGDFFQEIPRLLNPDQVAAWQMNGEYFHINTEGDLHDANEAFTQRRIRREKE